jgi:hypothetical protein
MVSDFSSAWSFFDQAKRCYTEWGSQMKVDSVTEQLESLTDYTPIGPSLQTSSSWGSVDSDGACIEMYHQLSKNNHI